MYNPTNDKHLEERYFDPVENWEADFDNLYVKKGKYRSYFIGKPEKVKDYIEKLLAAVEVDYENDRGLWKVLLDRKDREAGILKYELRRVSALAWLAGAAFITLLITIIL